MKKCSMKSKKRWRKKAAAVLSLMVCMVCRPASASAYTAHTQAEAVAWANAQIGRSLDYDGQYGAQCVDLIKYYYKYLCGDETYGNACDYASNVLPAGWTRVYGNYQPGDIAVWKVNHSCSTCNTSSFGHVGIILSADSVGFNAVNQNFAGNSSCSKNWFYVSTLQCAIRPDFSSGQSQTPAAAADISYSNVHTEFVDEWNAGLYGYINNPGRATVASVGAQVWNSTGKLVVDHKEQCGLNTSYVEQRLNIVGEAKPEGLESGETYTYQLYAVAGGRTYKSTVEKFTVLGNKQNQDQSQNPNPVPKEENQWGTEDQDTEDQGTENQVKVKKMELKKAVSPSSGKMKLRWNWYLAADGYQIAYSESSSFFSSQTDYKNMSFLRVQTTISRLSKGKTYYVKIRAYKKKDGRKYYGKWSNVKEVIIKR